jgi:hypothetical protein
VRWLQVAIPGAWSTTSGVVGATGGGDLQVEAGGDLLGGLLVVGRGTASVRVGGDVREDPDQRVGIRDASDIPSSRDIAANVRPVGLLLGLGDATARISAGGLARIEGAYDLARQSTPLAGAGGFTDRTLLDVTAVGTVTYLGNPWAALDLGRRVAATSDQNRSLREAPPGFALASLTGDTILGSSLRSPEPLELDLQRHGTLALLAKNNLIVETSVQRATGSAAPALFYAVDGSVCAQGKGNPSCVRQPPLKQAALASSGITLDVGTLRVVAGTDVLGGSYVVTGTSATDISLLSAGRDVYDPIISGIGPGSIVVQAGRDVVLGEGLVPNKKQDQPPPSSGGELVVGDQAHPQARGADLLVLAGVKEGRVDWDGFRDAYLDPANAEQRAVHDYFPELAAYMKSLSPAYAGLQGAELVAAFRALPPLQQQLFLTRVYFTELKETGIDHNDPASPRHGSYQRGTDAIHKLFTVDPRTIAEADRGNIILHGKRVETNDPADITLLAPYGSIEVGTDTPQQFVSYAKGGIVTRRGGDVRIMADGDVDLFTSRVFTLQGGDITIWTTQGSITAGSGAKTSAVQVPRVYEMTPDGVARVTVYGLQTGSGIGVLDPLDGAADRPPSRIDLIAPAGEVDAGDAGIRSAGSINIAAAVVVGIDNIQATGATTGVPKAAPPDVALQSSISQTTAAATQDVAPAADATPRPPPELPSIITVEVLGFTQQEGDAPEESPKKKKKGEGER